MDNREENHVIQPPTNYGTSNKMSSDPQIKQIQLGLEDVKDTMIDNIDQVIIRGNRISDLCDQTDQLYEDSISFRQVARKLKFKMRWKQIKITLGIIGLCLCVLLIVLMVFCNPNFSKCH